MKFEDLNLNEDILEAVSLMGFEETTPIQEKAIPIILENKDLIGCAQTGTGKTGAYLLPVLHKVAKNKKSNGVNTLIIVPTRELAVQIDQQIQGFSYYLSISSLPIYGGGDGSGWENEKKALRTGAEIIVATPGKLISHINLGNVNFGNLEHLILDEADKMLDMGFYPDLMKIVKALPAKRQTLMFSATMAQKIRDLAKSILTDPSEVSLELSKPAEGVLQAAYLCFDPNKKELIKRLIQDKPEYESILIFTSTKKNVGEIARALKDKRYEVQGISSDLEQKEREKTLNDFAHKKVRILVATDVISRGIDVKDINLVINYDVPGDAEDYVHRVGRTARANTTGVAITLISDKDMYRFQNIEKLIEKEIIKLPTPADIGSSPEWDSKSKGFGKKRSYSNKRRRN